MSPVGLSTLLSPLIKQVPIGDIKAMKIAVDVNALAFVAFRCTLNALRDERLSSQEILHILQNEDTYVHSYRTRCENSIEGMLTILRDEFKCVFVFDGEAFPEKYEEIAKRSQRLSEARLKLHIARSAFQNDTEHGNNAREFYNAMLECIRLDIKNPLLEIKDCAVGCYEADVTCATMFLTGEVDAVLSADYDPLLFGCNYLIKDISDDYGYVITSQDIYNALDINHSQFVDTCILMGTDYNKKIVGIGPKRALKEIKACKCIKNSKYWNDKGLNAYRLQQLYSSSHFPHIVQRFSLQCNKPSNVLESFIKIE